MAKVISISLFVLVFAWSAGAFAQPHPRPFDFDPQIAADPDRINQRLDELGDGLPGLPASRATDCGGSCGTCAVGEICNQGV